VLQELNSNSIQVQECSFPSKFEGHMASTVLHVAYGLGCAYGKRRLSVVGKLAEEAAILLWRGRLLAQVLPRRVDLQSAVDHDQAHPMVQVDLPTAQFSAASHQPKLSCWPIDHSYRWTLHVKHCHR
jgi:hypothetical protein